MALIVENGTGITDANCYADLAAVRAYALDRGITLSADDVAVSAQIYKATDYLDSLSFGLMFLSFPLDGGELCGVPSASAVARLSNATSQLCIEQHGGVDLAPPRSDPFIIEDKVGPITTKYSDKFGGGAGTTPTMPAVDAILYPLVKACGFPARTER